MMLKVQILALILLVIEKKDVSLHADYTKE